MRAEMSAGKTKKTKRPRFQLFSGNVFFVKCVSVVNKFAITNTSLLQIKDPEIDLTHTLVCLDFH